MAFNYNTLKKLYMNSPKFIKQLYGFIPWRVRMGKTYRETYNFLEDSEGWSLEKWDNYQRSKLSELMKYCYEYIPYYQEVFNENDINLENDNIIEEYKKLPFLTKEQVVKHAKDLLPIHINIDKFYKASTGGTTGKPVTIFFDKDSYKKEWAFKIYSWNKALGYTPNSKKATFRGVKLDEKLFYENPIYNEVRFSPFNMEAGALSEIVEKLLRYDPNFIDGYPSAIEQLTKYLIKRNINFSIKGIMLVSENIYPNQIELFREFYDVPIYSFYGLTERCILASMDSNLNNYYPHPAYGYTELINENGENVTAYNETAEIVGTGFINKAMPLLRYKTGDYSYWVPSNNSDWNFKALGDIKGRWDQEFLIGEDGTKVSLTALNMHSDVFKNIKKHQFCQKKKGEIIFRIVEGKGYCDSDEQDIQAQLYEKLGENFALKLKYVDEIELTQSGKSKYLIQHLN